MADKPKDPMRWAYVTRAGVIEMGEHVPFGYLPLARGPETELAAIIEVNARLAYDNKTLLVPGGPEAEDEAQAMEAVARFRELVEMRLRGEHGFPEKRGQEG